jgi:hypothetical protein
LVLLTCTTAARAAPPTLTYLYPAGAQRGQTVEVTAGGTFERWPVRGWADRPGVEIKPAKDRGKLTVTVAADAVPGTCWLRLYDEQGASTLRPFIVGTLPEVAEQEPNDDPGKSQGLPSASVVVNGRLDKPGDVDGFAVALHRGDTLVASVEANHTLGSPMDAVLQVLSADGFVLAQNHDDHGLDPQVVFPAPRDGRYVVRLFAFPAEPDAGIRLAGADTYVYRLTLTTGGFADHAFPLAVARDAPGEVEVAGWNVPAAARRLAVRPVPGSDVVTLWHPQLANTVAVLLEPHPCLAAAAGDRPHPVTLPVTVSGRIETPGAVGRYEFAAKKGQRLSFRADAGSLGSQLDPGLRLTDGAGNRLAQADDAAAGKPGRRDAELSFAVPQDGIYRLEVRDQAGQGSFRHFYRLRATPAVPDYALTVAADRFTLTPSKPLEIPVTVERRNGFDRDVEVRVEGLPDGVTAAAGKAAGPAGKTVSLRLEAKAGPVSAPLRIVGTVAGQADTIRTATAPVSGFPATPSLWLTVTR